MNNMYFVCEDGVRIWMCSTTSYGILLLFKKNGLPQRDKIGAPSKIWSKGKKPGVRWGEWYEDGTFYKHDHY